MTDATGYTGLAAVAAVAVDSPDVVRLQARLVRQALTVSSLEPGPRLVSGASAQQMGDLAFTPEVRLPRLGERPPRAPNLDRTRPVPGRRRVRDDLGAGGARAQCPTWRARICPTRPDAGRSPPHRPCR